MMFYMTFMMTIFGFLLAAIPSMLPIDLAVRVPSALRVGLVVFGAMIAIIGLLMLWIRAKKTGAEHIINPGRPGTILWFYVYRDGTIKITPSMREVEGQLYSKELDAQIHDLKSYRLFDHSVRFVPEGIGHAVDLDMILYVTLLKTKYGFNNIMEARKGAGILSPLTPKKPVYAQEYISEGGNIGPFE